jgi:hypothetical protein
MTQEPGALLWGVLVALQTSVKSRSLLNRMSHVRTETPAANPLTIELQNGQVLKTESNESIETDEIPVIDVARIYSDKLEDRQAVADQVRKACHDIGFFYVINHVSSFQTPFNVPV